MPASGISLVDANVWLALAVDAHVHHQTAMNWFAGQAESTCAFCRLTQLALLRHLTNPKIMDSANVQTQNQAWGVYDAFVSDPRVIYLEEPAGLTATFKALTRGSRPAHKDWSDAFLASFAICSGLEVVRFDADFTRFRNLTLRRLHV